MSCHSTFFFFSCLLYTQTHSYISSKTLIPTFFCLNILLSAVYRELLWLPNKYAVSLHPMMTFHSFSPYCFLSPQHLEIYLFCSHILSPLPLPQLRLELPSLSHSTWVAMCLEHRLMVGTQLKMHQRTEWMSTESVTQPRRSLPCACVCAAAYTKETVKLGLWALFHGSASVIPLWGLGREAFCLRIKGLFAFIAWNEPCHS